MRELNKMELEVVSGGVCEGLSYDECGAGIGDRIISEVDDLVSGLNGFGRSLGSWWYDVINC